MSIHTSVVRDVQVSTKLDLDTVKRALNILDDIDDDELTALIPVALGMAEKYCSRLFSESTVTCERDDAVQRFYIPFGENVVITSVTADGVPLTEGVGYEFSSVSEKLIVYTTYNKLTIEYTCGFTELPKTIERGVIFLIATIKNSGQDFSAGIEIYDLPIKATVFFDTEKHHKI